MNNTSHKSSTQNYFVIENQEVFLDEMDTSELILDIGGGGEGVIGQLKGSQVVAIDPDRKELEEAADGPLKIVMDAKDLLFLDMSFGMVTSFFTLMYIDPEEHKQVFKEVYRVISPGGRFIVWDLNFPERTDQKEDIVVVILRVILPDREIETGYGSKWPEKTIDRDYYSNLAQEVGFKVGTQKTIGQTFYLEFVKEPK